MQTARAATGSLKEALVIMTQALDELGDAYAIYGFSGQGRANVEVYPVKDFRAHSALARKRALEASRPSAARAWAPRFATPTSSSPAQTLAFHPRAVC